MREKTAGGKKTAMFIMALIFCAFLAAAHPLRADAAKAGTYSKQWKSGAKYGNPAYSVVINRISRKSIRFQVHFIGANGSPIYDTNVINAKIKNNKVTFKWKDSWNNQGTGVLKLYGSYVKIRMKVTKMAKWNRNSLGTNYHGAGKGYLKLKRTSRIRRVGTT